MKHMPDRTRQTQRGVALIVGLVILTVLTLLGITTMQMTTLQEKMAANQEDRHKALQAAESAARYAWSRLGGGAGLDVVDFTDNAANDGLYDLRSTNVVTSAGNKLTADWNAIASSTGAWPWDVGSKRAVMPDKVASTDPMELATAPQYVIGMHAPVLRKGTENRKCIPFSIIGAGQGSNATSRTLIALQVIPKSGCFRDLVN